MTLRPTPHRSSRTAQWLLGGALTALLSASGIARADAPASAPTAPPASAAPAAPASAPTAPPASAAPAAPAPPAGGAAPSTTGSAAPATAPGVAATGTAPATASGGVAATGTAPATGPSAGTAEKAPDKASGDKAPDKAPGDKAPDKASGDKAPDKAPAKLDRVPRVIGLSVGWGWNTVDKLPVSLDGKKQQPHGLSVFSDFLWQVGGLAGGWPSWLGFMAGFLYFPGQEAVRRETFAMEYGILVRHAVFPFSRVRPILSYGLGATQAWVTGVEERGIGHITRLGIGADVVVNPDVSLSVEVVYKIINMPSFGPPAGNSGPWDFHTFGALIGGHYGF